MKKLLLTLGLILGLTVSASADAYKTLMISSEARDVIGSLRISSDFTKVSTFDGLGYYALKYNGKSVYLGDLPNTTLTEVTHMDLYNYIKSGGHEGSMKSGNYLQLETNIYPYNKDKADCESFIKAVAPEYIKRRTRKGAFLLPNHKVKAGAIIASNHGNGHNGHTAILLLVKKDYIWVMDQNAYVYRGHHNDDPKKGGIVGIHKIKFIKKCKKNEACYYNGLNAYNYYTIRVKK